MLLGFAVGLMPLVMFASTNGNDGQQVDRRDGEERKINKGIKGGDSRPAYVELNAGLK